MAEIFSYNFDDGGLAAPLKKAFHFNPNQTPIYGDYLSAVLGYGFIYQGGSPLGESAPNSDLQTFTLYDRYPGTADYSAKLQVNFNAATTSDRWLDLVARARIDDLTTYLGWSGYAARVRTNFGAPTVELFKVLSGVYTSIAPSVPISGGIIDDHWGDYLKIRCSGSRVWVYWNDAELISVTESAAGLIYGNLRVGFAAENGAPGIGVQIRDLVVEDSTDELGLGGRFLLRVGDNWYGQEEMERLDINLQNLSLSYTNATGLTIEVIEPHTDPIWKPNEQVELKCWDDDTAQYVVRFKGKMRQRRRLGNVGNERNEYFASGPREQAKYVMPEHPVTSESAIIWNAEDDEEGFDEDYTGKTVGEMIQFYFDQNLDSLRRVGAIDPNPVTTPYVAGELSVLDLVPTRIQIGGSFIAIMDSLMALVPDTMYLVDPATFIWHFINVRTLSATDIEYTGDRIVQMNEFDDDTLELFTAVWIKSSRVEEHEDEASTKGGGLIRDWDRSLEPAWVPSYADRASCTYTVVSVTILDATTASIEIEGDKCYGNEWANCAAKILTGRASPDSAMVLWNTATTLMVEKNGGIWGPTEAPQAGDSVRVEDSRINDDATSENGFAYVHKKFRIADESKRNLVKHPCNKLTGERKIGGYVKPVTMQPTYVGLPGSGVVEAPFQIVQFIPNKGLCDTEGQYNAADVTLNYRWKDVEVRKLRYPAAGFMGTAWSEDLTKWGVEGASAGPDDWGLDREGEIRDDEWNEDTQDEGRRKAAERWLRARMDKPYRGQVLLHGLDWTYAVLQVSLTFSTQAQIRSATTGLETAYILPVSVTYTFMENRTLLALGDGGFLARSYEELLKAQSQTDAQAKMARILKQIEEFKKCFDRSDQPKAGADSGGSTCSTSVRGAGGGAGAPGAPGGGGVAIDNKDPDGEGETDDDPGEPPPLPHDPANPTGTESGGDEDGGRDSDPTDPGEKKSPGAGVTGGDTDPNPPDTPEEE